MDEYTLLLVDDEPSILQSLKRLFREARVRVLTASDGQEALGIIRSESVQVLVTDNIMPRMTGVELIKKVKQCSPQVIRIILSGHSNLDSVLTAVNEGEVFRFILKPWNDIDLKAAVALAMAHYKLVEDNAHLENELKAISQMVLGLRSRHPELFEAGNPEESAPTERLCR